jgi:hypothetical protein
VTIAAPRSSGRVSALRLPFQDLAGGGAGYRVTAFDPEFERRMAIARDIMAEDRNFLRELARQ